MRFLAASLVVLSSLTFLSLTAEPAQAAGVCADESGHNYNPDLYNNMHDPQADCDGMVCYGYSGNGQWQTCVLPPIYCVESGIVPCGPGIIVGDPCDLGLCQLTASAGVEAPALCVYGDAYNNQADQPSSRCDGAVCTGFDDGDWNTCVLDCTTDGCPRVADPKATVQRLQDFIHDPLGPCPEAC